MGAADARLRVSQPQGLSVVAALVANSYRAQKTAHAVVAGAFMGLFHQLMRPGPTAGASEREALQRRFRALIEADIAHVEKGDYPERLLFRTGLRDTLRALPGGVFEL